MQVEALQQAIHRVREQGRTIVAAVACACATPIGAFDQLGRNSQGFARRRESWMHVDAAHGGAACLSDRHKHLVRGLEQADSGRVGMPIRCCFMPALCAFAFFKNKAHRFSAFEQDAPYLFDPSNPGMAAYDSGSQTLECTKRAAAFGLWGMWSLFGRTIVHRPGGRHVCAGPNNVPVVA